jgi:hypothetical protein
MADWIGLRNGLCVAAVAAALWPCAAASAQSVSAEAAAQPMPEEGHRAFDGVEFLAGAALGLGMHEAGHLVFDAMFDANPDVTGVHFGSLPFFAITHRGDMSPRREFAISSAGFWMQGLSSEWILTKRPALKDQHAPVAKGILAFNVLNSTGYAFVAFARSGPFERDTRGMADSVGVDERAIGVLVLAPAVFDAIRYYKPEARWAIWASRAAKVGSVLLVIKQR